jgi:hypothetical protein
MDGAELGAWIGSVVATAAASLAGALFVRRRRRRGGSWRPRLRFKGYVSLRTHESAPGDSLEPGPDDEGDTKP